LGDGGWTRASEHLPDRTLARSHLGQAGSGWPHRPAARQERGRHVQPRSKRSVGGCCAESRRSSCSSSR
jgi:hypothetical protein